MVLDGVRVAVACVAVLFLPGWLLLYWARWELCRKVGVSVIPAGFVLSVALITALGVVGHLAGAGLNAVLYVILAIDVLALLHVAALLAGRRPRLATGLFAWVRGPGRAEFGVTAFAAMTAGIAAWAGIWLSRTADTFYHLAVSRTLLKEDELLGSRVIYADSTTARIPSGLDPIAGTWHLALALVAKLSGLDIVVVWTLLPSLMALLLVLAFYTLATVLLRNPWWALAATVLQFVLFMDMDFRTSLYPNVIAKAMLWMGLAAAFRYAWQGDRRGLAIAGAMAFAMSAIHIFLVELYLASLGVFAVAVLLLVRWLPNLRTDLRRLAVLIGSGLMAALPMVIARAQGAGLLSTSETSTDEHGVLVRLDRALEGVPPLEFLGDTVFRPITSLPPAHWAAHNLYVYGQRSLGYGDLLTPEVATYLLALLLIPAFLRGRLPSVFLLATTLAVPLVVFNPPLVRVLTYRIDDIALVRLPQLVPNALVWVAVLAPLTERVWRLALSRRLRLWWRYALASARRWLPGVRLRRSAPAPALAVMYGSLVGAVIVVAAVFGADGVTNGLLEKYRPAEGARFSVPDSKDTALQYDEGVYGFLRQSTSGEAVVLSDAVSSYYISGLVGMPVVAVPWSHSPRRVERLDGPQRRADVVAALEGDSLDESLRIVDKYRVTYVVTAPSHPSPLEDRTELFRLVYSDEDARVYEYVGAPR